ncbi:MAG: TraB/GumN family protein [Acidiferrobacterales bacterium]
MTLPVLPRIVARYCVLISAALVVTTVVAAPLGPVKHGKGLLWRISAPGLVPSYLFGTMHSGDSRVNALPTTLTDPFDRATSYSMELIFTGAGIVRMAEIMFYGENEGLKDVIGERLYEQTRVAFIKSGVSTQDLGKKKPWAVILALGTPRKTRGVLFLDLKLQRRATLQHKPTYGLETMDEQLQVFEGLSIADQIQLLREALTYQSTNAEQIDQLMKAYLSRDLAALAAISDRYQAHAGPAYSKLMDRLLVKRNYRMLQRMQPRLKEGNAFIALGALHLPGREGLLTLLENGGYRVTSVY